MRRHPGPAEHAFGSELERLRYRHRLKQAQVFPHLGWSADRYSRLESGIRAPVFDELPALARGLRDAGVVFTLQDVQRFLTAAQQRIAQQRTYKDEHTDDEWAAIFHQIARDLGLLDSESTQALRPHLLDTRHLVRRESWHQHMLMCVDGEPPPKLLVITGAPGIGKSSELSWLAMTMACRGSPAPHIVLCDLRALDPTGTPDAALNLVFGTLFTELRAPLSQSTFTMDEQTTLLLGLLEQQRDRFFVIVDHAESALLASGWLASSWERFISRMLRSSHRATFVLATRQWPGWYGDEPAFVREIAVPAFSHEDAVLVLRRLGLDSISEPLLLEIARRVGGIPRGLEWAAALVTQPLAVDEWQDIFTPAHSHAEEQAHRLRTAVERLLAEPHLFGGPLGEDIAPVLSHIIERQRLSSEAQWLLDVVSCSPIPLSQPALLAICGEIGTRPLRELRRASLLVSYEQRVHVNALVASATLRQLERKTRRERETTLVAAYQAWLDAGTCEQHEAGSIVYHLIRLLLLHHRLLDAAQYALRYGWLAFNLGYSRQLADLAMECLSQNDQPTTGEMLCGQLLLETFFAPLQGQSVDGEQIVQAYRQVQETAHAQEVKLWPLTHIYIMRLLVVFAISRHAFEEAQALFETTVQRVTHSLLEPEVQAALCEVQALFLARQADNATSCEQADGLRCRAIELYRQGCDLLVHVSQVSPLADIFRKKRLARLLTNLGYQYDRQERYEQAIPVLDQSRLLKEQGYVEPGSLAATYDELAQAHAGIGRFRDALRFSQRALAESERFASAGDAHARNDRRVFQVNYGHLLLHIGQVDDAERLLREALPHIHETRSVFTMQAEQDIQRITAWRDSHPSAPYQLDWRWIDRLRDALAYNSFWWLSWAGPFTDEEQAEWEHLASLEGDEETHYQQETLIRRSRDRELAAALAEEREPRLWYPVIPLDEVRARLGQLQALDIEVCREEPNRIVRDLYHDTIVERIAYLCLIEAAAIGDREQFRTSNAILHPLPTREEMAYVFEQVNRMVRLGLQHEQTAGASQDVIQVMHEQLGLSFEASQAAMTEGDKQAAVPLSPTQRQHLVTAQTVQRFLQVALVENGCEGWQVMIDLNAHAPRVEAASRLLVLPNTRFSLDEIRLDLLPNEVIHHIGDAVVGEQSLLGLLSIGTRGYMPISEGRALYVERQTAAALGKPFDDSKVWLGALSAGLASGVMTSPQSFRSLYQFLRTFLVLYRLIRRPDQNEETARHASHELALMLCLRAFRGVPDLDQPGVCYSKDVVYLRGLRLIEQAVATDATLLQRLAVGRIALEHLPAIEESGIAPPLQPLWNLAHDPDLDSYILSFEERENETVQKVS